MGTVEILAGAGRWIAVTVAVVATAAGIWWALADFILDRVGPPRADWGDQLR